MQTLQHYTRHGWQTRTQIHPRQLKTGMSWEKSPQLEAATRILADSENDLRFAVGRYIHDTSQQHLQLAQMLVLQQAQLLEHDPDQAAAQLAAFNTRLSDLLTKANDALSFLRKEVLLLQTSHTAGLQQSLAMFILDDFPRMYPNVSFTITTDFEALSDVYTDSVNTAISEKMLISAFVREGLRNAYKHANAGTVSVVAEQVFCRPQDLFGPDNTSLSDLWQLPGPGCYLCISVHDDGQGFDQTMLPALREESGHWSFYEIDTRAMMLGGFSRIETEPGQGTRWELFLPVLQPKTT